VIGVFGRKGLDVGVLLGFLVFALVFAVLPVGSQWQRQYDPWADINDDGWVDGKDIAYICSLFGKTGDPAKTVIISRHEAYYEVRNFTVTSAGYYFSVNTTGFAYLSLAVRVQGTATVNFCWYFGNPAMPPLSYASITVVNSDQYYQWQSQVNGPYFYLYYQPAQGVINCYTVIAIYLTA
jgi:hypothetical protein